MEISGSSAVVVGGTGGMGEATVRRLNAAGAHVVVADVNDEKGKALVEELGIRYLHTDAGSEDDVAAAFAEAATLKRVSAIYMCVLNVTDFVTVSSLFRRG